MKSRIGKWDSNKQAILTGFKSKFQVQKGGKGRIVPASTPYVHYSVNCTGEFAKPKVGSKLSKCLYPIFMFDILGGTVKQINFFTSKVGKVTT